MRDKLSGLSFDAALTSVGPGWRNFVETAWHLVEQHDGEVLQVKDKFGALRIYF